jgi:hypothetical protein
MRGYLAQNYNYFVKIILHVDVQNKQTLGEKKAGEKTQTAVGGNVIYVLPCFPLFGKSFTN